MRWQLLENVMLGENVNHFITVLIHCNEVSLSIVSELAE